MRPLLFRFLSFCLVLLLVAMGVVVLLPTIASTEWGKKQIVQWVNGNIPGTLEIDTLNLAWTKGQAIGGVALKDPQGRLVFEVKQCTTEATLWQLIRRSTHLGHTQFSEFNAAIQPSENGSTNLQDALGIKPGTLETTFVATPTYLSEVDASVRLLSPGQPLTALIKGKTKLDQLEGYFDINIDLQNFGAANWAEIEQDVKQYLSIDGSKGASIQAKIVNFPVDLLDRALSLFNSKTSHLFRSLLGDSLNLDLEKEPSQQGLSFKLNAQSPRMNGYLRGSIDNGLVALREPGVFQFHLIPEFLNPLLAGKLEFLEEAMLHINFNDMKFPLTFFDSEAVVDANQLIFTTAISLPQVQLVIPSFGPTTVSQVSGNVTATSGDMIDMQLQGKATHEEEDFHFQFASNLVKPKHLAGLAQAMTKRMKAKANIIGLPLHIFPHVRPEILDMIGSNLDTQLELAVEDEKPVQALLTIHTPKLDLINANFQIEQDISLKEPTHLKATLSQDCLSALLKNDKFLLAEPCPVDIIVKDLHIPWQDFDSSSFSIASLIPTIQFPHLFPMGIFAVQDIHLGISGTNLDNIKSLINWKIALLPLDSSLGGDPFAFSFNSDWRVAKEQQIEMSRGVLDFKNSLVNGSLEAKLTAARELILNKPVRLNLPLTPRTFHHLLTLYLTTRSVALPPILPTLKETASLDLTLEPFTIDLNNVNLTSIQLKGSLDVDKLLLEVMPGTQTLLEKIELPWEINPAENRFVADLKGHIQAPTLHKSTSFSSHVQIWPINGNFTPTHAQTELQIDFDGMPTSLVATALGSEELGVILGPIIDLKLRTFLDPTRSKPGYFDLSLDSANMHVQGRFKVNHTATIFDPAKIPSFRLTIAPDSFEALKKLFNMESDLKLASPTTLSGHLSQFQLPLENNWQEKAIFDLALQTSDVHWQNAAPKPLNMEAKIASSNLREQIDFSLQPIKGSSLKLQGKLSHLFDQQGSVNSWQKMGLHAKIEGNKVPSDVFQSLFLGNREVPIKLQALFGEAIDLNFKCKLQELSGHLQAAVEGTQGKVTFDGHLDRGVLTLNQPLEGSVQLTPQFTKTFLTPHVSLLSSAVGSEAPIKFSLSPENFACPLIPFRFEQVKIGKGVLDLGKIRFRNEGELSSILSFVHSISDPYFTIWFTPLHFQMNNGKLVLKRMDLLVANSYTLASWGNINLMEQQADLVLGLSAQSLQYAFGVKGLDEQYLLQVPIRSAKGKVEIDKKRATARIASLIAQSQGGLQGKIFGNILDVAMSTTGEISPPPSTQPFPWKDEFKPVNSAEKNNEDEKPSQVAEDNTEKKKKKKKKRKSSDDNPIKDIQDGAIQVLDQLFNKLN